MKRLTFLILVLIVVWLNKAQAEIDLSNQFPRTAKIQRANTCYLHAGISLLEAALARSNRGITLDDTLISLSYSNRLFADKAFNEEWRNAQISAIAKNIYFFSRGKILSPLDFGMFNKELLQFLMKAPLYQSDPGLQQEVETFWNVTNEAMKKSSHRLTQATWKIHPAQMGVDEILLWEPMKTEIQELSQVVQRKYEWLAKNGKPIVWKNAHVRSIDLPVPATNSELLENLKIALRDGTTQLTGTRSQCDAISKTVQAQLRWYLKHQIPVGIGLYPAGMEFSQSMETNAFKRVYRNNPHALVLIGSRVFRNEEGSAEEYFVFRDSGYFEESRYARMPVNESCRILNAVVVLTSEDVKRADTDRPPFASGPQPAFVTNVREMQEYLAKQTLTCGEAGACPSGIAKLISFKSDPNSFEEGMRFADRCTAFLIGPQLLATNSHCLPKEIRAAGSNCSGKVFAIFQNAGPVGCTEVLTATQVPFDSLSVPNDFALIQLGKSIPGIEVFDVSRNGFEDGLVVEHHFISNQAEKGVIQKQQCRTVHGTYLLPTFQNRMNPRVTVAGCTVKGGDSGSPLIHPESGKVLGIIDSTAFTPEFEEASKMYSQQGLLLEPILPLAIAGNFACIALSGKKDSLPEACKGGFGRREILTAQHEAFYNSPELKQASATLDQSIQAWASNRGLGFQWNGSIFQTHSNFDRSYIPLPSCVSDQELEIQMDWPVWRYSVGFDRHYKFTNRISRESPVHARFTILSRTGGMFAVSLQIKDNESVEAEVPGCPS